VKVQLTAEANQQLRKVPLTIVLRMQAILKRLEAWPEVSGAKPMRGKLKGHFRIRTGDWRILFQVSEAVIVVRIEHRSTVYEE
jgi:mRNA-degrading endonuclease RelE of RelBE toxin-antitoxin system